jgi:hypothetical protein
MRMSAAPEELAVVAELENETRAQLSEEKTICRAEPET